MDRKTEEELKSRYTIEEEKGGRGKLKRIQIKSTEKCLFCRKGLEATQVNNSHQSE